MQKNHTYVFILAVIIGGICFLLFSVLPLAAETKSDTQIEQWTRDVIRQRLSGAASARQTARQVITPATASQLGVDLEVLEARVRTWVELESAYDGLLSEMQRGDDLLKEISTSQEDLTAFQQRGLLKKPPYALSYYDALTVEYESQQQRMETAGMALKAAQRSLDESRANLQNAQTQLLSFKEAKTNSASAKGLWVKQGFELDTQVADAKRRLYALRVDNLQKQNQISTNRAELARGQADLVRLGLAYDNKDLQDQILALEQKKKKLRKGLEVLQKNKKEADQQWLNLQGRIQKTVYAEDLTRMEERLKGLDQWRETYQEAIGQHDEMLRLTDQQQEAWRQRYRLLKQAPERAALLQWVEQNKQRLAHINRVLPIEQQRQNNLWQQTGALEEAAKELYQTGKQSGKDGFNQALRQMAIYRLDYISMLVANRELEERLGNEIDVYLERKPINYQAEKLWAQLRSIWNYQVWVIDGRPLTIHKIVVALVILLAGIVAIKIMIRRIAGRILALPQIKATTAATIEKLLLYLGYLLVVLFALRMVNIPLAAFAFLGGAIAIGVGFGAQNLINNFISGFIIMGEQPINIGDLIEVDGVLGQVEEIGARCTRIRSGENIHILVPNSSFLEKNITNWTLSDRLIRAYVTVGVVYGSPVDQVEKLLLQSCGEFDSIRKSPAPFVLFTDFGDNALIFKVHFWIGVKRVIERHLIESQLRFRIDALFREANIVIAFPQRDVHLDSSEPLKIELTRSTKNSGNQN